VGFKASGFRVAIRGLGWIIDSKNTIVTPGDYGVKGLSIYADIAYSHATQIK